MPLPLFQRQLKMLTMLVNDGPFSIEEIANHLDISERMIYRYLKDFKQMNLEIIKKDGKISISPLSPYLNDLLQGIRFTKDEATTIFNIIGAVNNRSPEVRHLRDKLASLYQKRVLTIHGIDERTAVNRATLFNAIQLEQIVCLRNYCSPSSGKVSNRIVEPYLFLANNTEVRCFELSTQTNKTFKVSRAETIEIIDLKWSYNHLHAAPTIDIFHFTGETTIPVSLHLGTLAKNVLLEEYPEAEAYITPLGDKHYRLDIDVCSFKGIGRFVLGLYEDVHVLENDEFKAYIAEQIRKMANRHNIAYNP